MNKRNVKLKLFKNILNFNNGNENSQIEFYTIGRKPITQLDFNSVVDSVKCIIADSKDSPTFANGGDKKALSPESIIPKVCEYTGHIEAELSKFTNSLKLSI